MPTGLIRTVVSLLSSNPATSAPLPAPGSPVPFVICNFSQTVFWCDGVSELRNICASPGEAELCRRTHACACSTAVYLWPHTAFEP